MSFVERGARANIVRKTSHLALAIVLVGIIGISAVIGLSIYLTTNNTATVQTGPAVTLYGQQLLTASCSAKGDTNYVPSPTIAWGTVSSGTLSKEFVCVENVGTAAYTITLGSDLPSSYGSVTSPSSGLSIAAGSVVSIELDWNIAATAPTGSVSFHVTFQ